MYGYYYSSDSSFWEEFGRFLETYDASLHVTSVTGTYIDDFRNAERIPVRDVMNDLEITETTAERKTILSNSYIYCDDNGDNHEIEGELAARHGKMVDISVGTSDTPERTVVNGTYENNEIRFKAKDLKNIQKGVVYNVVNQVRLISFGKTVLGKFMESEEGTDCIQSGDVYYVGGDNITNTNLYTYPTWGYNNTTGTEGFLDIKPGLVRNTEYRWGEIVFASVPDAPTIVDFDKETYSVTWEAPCDEGLGTDEEGNAVTTEYVNVNKYKAELYNGKNRVYSKVISRSGNKQSTVIPTELIEPDIKYTVKISAVSNLGESEAALFEFYKPSKVEITMTADQPTYHTSDTVVFTETVKNIGVVKLTNVTVNQSVFGKYGTDNSSVKIMGTKLILPELGAGESFTFTYSVPASAAVNNKITNNADVSADQKATDESDFTVYIINPNIGLTKTVSSSTFTVDDTIIYKDTVTNTSTETMKNIIVTEDNEYGSFIDIDPKAVQITDKPNVIILIYQLSLEICDKI